MSDKRIPASILPGLVDMALHARIPVGALFREAGIEADIIGSRSSWLTFPQIDRLNALAIEWSGDEALGLHAGENSHFSSMDMLGYVIATSDTLRDAALEWLRYKDLQAPFVRFEVLDGCDVAGQSITHLRCAMTDGVPIERHRFYTDLTLSGMLTIARLLYGPDLPVLAARFSYVEPAALADHQRIFRCPLEFSSPVAELVFPRQVFDEPLITAFPEYHRKIERLVAHRLHKLERSRDLSVQVYELLEQQAASQLWPSLEEVAQQLELTGRTLQRRLGDEQTSFNVIRDNLRLVLASRGLQDGLSGDELARQLGFSDAAAFHHAFRRWTGLTPGQYRRQQTGQLV